MVRAYTVQHAECFVDMLMQANAVIQAQPYTDERGNRPDLRFAVLQALKDNSDGITTDGLAASSGVPRPTVYRFLQDFTKIGLVDRRGEGTKAHPYVYFAARLPVSEKST
jgi:Fic family protein